MEAALRTAYELVTKKELKNLDFVAVRGMTKIKEATVDLDGTKLNVAVAHGLANAKALLERVKRGGYARGTRQGRARARARSQEGRR